MARLWTSAYLGTKAEVLVVSTLQFSLATITIPACHLMHDESGSSEFGDYWVITQNEL
jgi:hypothetical protein